MKKIVIFCIYQQRKYRFTAPAGIKLDELERRIKERLDVPENFELQRINTSISSRYPIDGETFEFQECSDDLLDITQMEILYGPPPDKDSNLWDWL